MIEKFYPRLTLDFQCVVLLRSLARTLARALCCPG